MAHVRGLKFDPLLKAGVGPGWTWRIFDVSGCRTLVSMNGNSRCRLSFTLFLSVVHGYRTLKM